MKTFYYFNDKSKKIFVTDETVQKYSIVFSKSMIPYENASIISFFNKVKDYSNVVDVGAQVGLYTLCAKFFPNCTFYSFEIYEPSFKILNDNISLNDITNVKTYNLGISNVVGNTELSVCTRSQGLHTLGKNPLRFNNPEKVEVKTTTLDTLFYEQNIPVHYIKIDTEGWEYFILLGSIKTIEKWKPIIQMEWNEINMKQCEVNVSQLEKLINDLGYVKIEQHGEEIIIAPKNTYNI